MPGTVPVRDPVHGRSNFQTFWVLLTDEFAAGYDPVFKVNPPLRTEADVAELRRALADGTIDCVATDHAPHPVEAKETEWA